ncbi:lipid A deacylase LpxR family protein [Muricoccus radiodurans]|uniref:lipid A deacylase LpxR family protein n=1 Tax=Muricoccus radiodurans TaxID=2231721 RepID=UPI003CF094E2
MMRLAAGCLMILLGVAPAAIAQTQVQPTVNRPDYAGTLSLTIENDVFGGTDRYYSNGFLIAWQSPTAFLPAPISWVDRQLDAAFGPADLRWGLSFGQNIFTPQETQRRTPDPRDRPYAGYLYGAATLVRTADAALPWEGGGRRYGSQTLFELQLGVVGPSALGEFVQNNWHDLLRIRNAEGWDRQLKDEFAATALVERRWRLPLGQVAGLETEVIPVLSAAVGNVQTYAAGGAMFRIGDGLRRDWGPVRIRPALAGSGFVSPERTQPNDHFGWYVFAGLEGRAVARDIFLDGNTWRDGPRVDKRIFVGDMQLGAAVVWGDWRVAYTQVYRTEEFYGQRGRQSFGSFSVSYRF